MSLRNFFSKFVEFDEVDQVTPKGEVPLTVVSSNTTLPSSPPPASASNFSLVDIYRQQGISPVPFTAEQALEILAPLPKGLAPETKHQVLRDILQVNAISQATIVEDARRKVGALATATDGFKRTVADFIAQAERDITTLQEQIEEKRKSIGEAQSKEEQFARECQAEAKRLADFLQFFGGDTRATGDLKPSDGSGT
jgi:hypothetical protein